MSTPSCRTSSERASAWACAAIDRNPCGPPSQRHQISGPSSARERRMTSPASGNRRGRTGGRGEPTGAADGADTASLDAAVQGRPPVRSAHHGGARCQHHGPRVALRDRRPRARVLRRRRPAAVPGRWRRGWRHRRRASAPGAAQVASERSWPWASASTAASSPSSRTKRW